MRSAASPTRVYSYHAQYTEAGLFTCYAGTTPSRATEVIGLLRRELADVRDGGLTADGVRAGEGAREGIAGALRSRIRAAA